MWCLLRKKVPTWDRMKQRGLEGPRWCSLCKGEEETSLHLFLKCPFSTQAWRIVSTMLASSYSWQGTSIEEAWKFWVQNPSNKRIKALPRIITRGIWIARNSAIFKSKDSIPNIVVAKSLAILAHFPQEKVSRPPRNVMEEQVNQNRPWDFFDGASKDLGVRCGGGGVLHLLSTYFLKIKWGLGQGSNNCVELMALKLLLSFSGEKG